MILTVNREGSVYTSVHPALDGRLFSRAHPTTGFPVTGCSWLSLHVVLKPLSFPLLMSPRTKDQELWTEQQHRAAGMMGPTGDCKSEILI